MSPDVRRKRTDIIGVSVLGALTVLSLAFRASPIAFMNPGFPILSYCDWLGVTCYFPTWHRFPRRTTSLYDFEKVAYYGEFYIDDNSQLFPDSHVPTQMHSARFLGYHTVTWYSNEGEAAKTLDADYEAYVVNNGSFPLLITDIPDLDFVSAADRYYLWCEQYSREATTTTFSAEEAHTCFYWAAFGPYLSELRLYMSPPPGGGLHYSLEILAEVLQRADSKLSRAWR